ncbi:S8 family peptidase [Rugamonas rubra]|uniref:Peptidase inhibitor I9 n=1 Tax=Rugamonas rubra TaxID=758825 RepID=A0A1I4L1T8_9BURK|nr:S8 family peptidase [Rugamonas rubra]SFL84881.1 Peptidase inhibitor I9 [Rugamonas rubra]
MKLRPVRAAVLLLLSGMALCAHAEQARRPYIIQLADQPVASYTGGVVGLKATQPGAGQRLNLAAADVQLYSDYLGQKQSAVKAVVAAAPILYDYKVVLNGFAALLTDSEAQQLKANSAVASVVADTPRALQTSYTPSFLGLDQPGGLWSQLGGKEHAGENVVIGIIDGGVWPENPAYADRVDGNGTPTFDNSGTLAYTAPLNWHGACDSGEGFGPANCNNKLIGARFFDAAFLSTGRSRHWSDFASPRDSLGDGVGEGGHGTHTSTTAGGNNGVATLVHGIPMGKASGMAPRARVAMYKVCWSYDDATKATGAKNSCWGGDSVAAIERAVLDGAHVLNYSIGGSDTINDPVEQAFLHAANAGVFVAASAGNDGPANTVSHLSPWLTTVAASTHNRLMKATLSLGNGASYTGASLNTSALPAKPIVRSEDAGLAGAGADALRLCYSAAWNGGAPALDPAKVAGKVVTCVRGTNDRVDKSLAVLQAGGVGMVLVDNGAGLVAEVHSVPTVHLSSADGAAVKAYAAAPAASAALGVFSIGIGATPAPVVAAFSSRGPNLFDANVLKPDLAAPGVEILAGLSPKLTPAQKADVINGTLVPPPNWGLYQGTSMASPHVAGVAALLRQQHPTWSPAAIKSALMTSGSMTFPDGLAGMERGVLPWGQGAGHLNPNGAADPGLVYDAGQADFKKYMCGAGMAGECGSGSIAGYNLNLASITVGNVLGTAVVNRAVTNVGASAATYNASISVPGYNAVVAPNSLTLAPGQTKAFTVSLSRNGAPDNVWQYGKLSWTDGSHVVNSPVTARSGKPLSAPALVGSDRASGSRTLSITSGFAGRLGLASGGLKAVNRSALLNVAQAASGSVDTLEQIADACNAAGSGVHVQPFSVPAQAVVAAFETFNRDTGSNGGDDLDMALLSAGGEIVASSLHGGSNEAIVLANPPAGNYKLCVIGYAAANGTSTDFTLSSAVVGRADVGGNLKAMGPGKVYSGGTASVNLSWSGLAAGQRYYGGVQYIDPANTLLDTTVLLVQTNNALPLPPAVARSAPSDQGK